MRMSGHSKVRNKQARITNLAEFTIYAYRYLELYSTFSLNDIERLEDAFTLLKTSLSIKQTPFLQLLEFLTMTVNAENPAIELRQAKLIAEIMNLLDSKNISYSTYINFPFRGFISFKETRIERV